MNVEERNQILILSDEELLKLCRVDHYKATGKGGQKRNKTESAVRVTHESSGVTGNASDSRQQGVNKIHALRSLRLNLAFELRAEPAAWTGQWQMNEKNAQYPLLVATVIDALEAEQYQVSTVATSLGKSTGQLIKVIARDDKLWQFVNRQRQKLQLKPLKKN